MVYYIITDCFRLFWWRIYSIFIYLCILWIIRFTYIDFYTQYSAALFDIFNKLICTLLSFGLALLQLVHVSFWQLSGYPQEGSPFYCEQPNLNQWALWMFFSSQFFVWTHIKIASPLGYFFLLWMNMTILVSSVLGFPPPVSQFNGTSNNNLSARIWILSQIILTATWKGYIGPFI